MTAYLITAVGGQVTDAALRPALDQLAARVGRRLGDQPLHDLARMPDDPGAREHVARAIGNAADLDPDFSADLGRLQEQLDAAGGRAHIGPAYQPYPGPQGAANRQVTDYRRMSYQAIDGVAAYARDTPVWAVTCLGLGFGVLLVGFGLVAVAVLSHFGGGPAPSVSDQATGNPDGSVVGVVLFLAGAVLAGAGQVGVAVGRRRGSAGGR